MDLYLLCHRRTPRYGKTLVSKDIANKHLDKKSELYSVYLSGNGPLVAVLSEALHQDEVTGERERGAAYSRQCAEA